MLIVVAEGEVPNGIKGGLAVVVVIQLVVELGDVIDMLVSEKCFGFASLDKGLGEDYFVLGCASALDVDDGY